MHPTASVKSCGNDSGSALAGIEERVLPTIESPTRERTTSGAQGISLPATSNPFYHRLTTGLRPLSCVTLPVSLLGSAGQGRRRGNSGENPGLPRSGERKRPPSTGTGSVKNWEATANRWSLQGTPSPQVRRPAGNRTERVACIRSVGNCLLVRFVRRTFAGKERSSYATMDCAFPRIAMRLAHLFRALSDSSLAPSRVFCFPLHAAR